MVLTTTSLMHPLTLCSSPWPSPLAISTRLLVRAGVAVGPSPICRALTRRGPWGPIFWAARSYKQGKQC